MVVYYQATILQLADCLPKCNLMTGDDTLCRICRMCYFLFLLSAQNQMFNVKMK